MAIRGAGAETGRPATADRQYLSPWLWVATAGAVLQLMALGSDFYLVPGADSPRKGAWLGIPHTSDLILVSAIITIGLFAVTAANRSPARGRSTGLWIGIVGLLALLQLGYRMIAPPFAINIQGDQTLANLFSGDCQFYCSPAAAAASGTELLTGIWFGLVGCILLTVAGFAHASSRRAGSSPARPWAAAAQPGPGPWLALAAVGAAASFLIAYTVFPFYVTQGRGGAVSWSGWLPTPHTSSLVLALAVVAVWLVVLAARGRSPLSPSALGGALGLIGFIIASRIFLRILQSPFGSPAEIRLPAYIALAAAVLVIIAGAAHARATHQGAPGPEPAVSDGPMTGAPMESGDQPRHGRASGPMFCAIPAAGAGDGITGVPIASGPVGGVLLSVVLAVLVLATWWLMRRWSGGAGPATAASALVPEAAADVPAGDLPAAGPDVRSQERELARL